MDDSETKGTEIPSYFLCPISLEIMKDPVTLSTGITYDRQSIEKWLCTENIHTCPVTRQFLTDIELIPNHTLRRSIQTWCTINAPFGIKIFPTPQPPVSKSQILKLIQDSVFPDLQMKSLRKLKTIVNESDMNKRLMEAVGAADYLAYIISSSPSPAAEASDEAISILYLLRLSRTGLKSLFGMTGEFAEALTLVVRRASSYESRTHSMLLLKSMIEAAEPIQVTSFKLQFFIDLTHILVNQIISRKAALKILIRVCPMGRNKTKVVEAGVVPVLIDILLDCDDKRISELALMVLDNLCMCADGRAELLKHGAGLAVVSKRIFRVSQSASEWAVRILHSVAKFSGNTSVVQEMLKLGIVENLCFLVQVDNFRSKSSEKAREILKMHGGVWKNSSCIPQNLVSSYPS